MEYSLPREQLPDALRELRRLIAERRFPVNFPIEVRFVAGDDIWLSPAHGRESAYVAVHVAPGKPSREYFRAAEEILAGRGGRPHWGKRHFQTAATLAPRYPDWERFQAVRNRLDPGRLFTNSYVRAVLGP
jgi:L-gulono-1,4-lactone dehydrogenase